MEGHEYGYTIFEPFPAVNVSSSKSILISSMTVTSVESNNYNEDAEIHLSLTSEKLQNDDTFCKAIMKFMDEKKMLSSEKILCE